MKGLVSFHAVDLSFFDELIAPLVAGGKVNPEEFLNRAIRIRQTSWVCRGFAVAIEELAASAEAPPPAPGATPWQRLRANLEKIDYRPDEKARKVARAFDPDLHLHGRPFFILEGSAEKVGNAVDAYAASGSDGATEKIARAQLALIDPELGRELAPTEIGDLSSDLGYRSDLLNMLKKVYELAYLAREGRSWVDNDTEPRPASEALPEELPWRATALHARAFPFWVARDVDGLETICGASGVRAPTCLSPAWRVFAQACEAYPALKESLGLELRRPKDVGAFVAPAEIPELLQFLAEHGARIINAAARGGEGPMATALLRKIKECAVYAQRHKLGYLEASGIE